MNKIYLLFFTFLSLFLGQTFAQVSSYTFSQSTGTYTPIVGTLVAEATNASPGVSPESAPMDDFTFTNIPISFPFKFNGVNYTSFNANTNGWISFGASSTVSINGPISSSNNYNAVIAASAFDLMGVFATSATRTLGSNVLTAVANTAYCKVGKPIQGEGIPAGSTITSFDANSITISNAATASSVGTYVSFAMGEIRTSTSGIAPNRTFSIQYSGFAAYSASLNANFNNTYLEFQINLFEGGINGDAASASIIYGSYFRVAGSSNTQVGLRGQSNADFNNRTSTTSWSATTAGTTNSRTITFSNTVFPVSGLTFTWFRSNSFVDYCNLQFPSTATIDQGGSEIVYTRGYEPGVTEAAGAGAGIEVWIGTNSTNTNPETWPLSAWTPATFNVQVGNDDEFSASIGSSLSAGTYYYASRWQLNNGSYRYGGYSATGGNFWDGINNVSGVLIVNPPPPSNDDCANAIGEIGGMPIAGTNVGASESLAAINCGGTTSSTANDVWYSFTALSSGDVVISVVNTTGGLDAVIQVFSGSCGTLTDIGCANATGANGNEVFTLNNLVEGEKYFVRIYGNNGSEGGFVLLASGAALPITVEYFRGTKQPNGNLLDWKVTCYNSPIVQMEVERSADGRKYNTIQSQTETALRCLQPFSYTDTNPSEGINYYRLKSTDVDGKITYSATVAMLNKIKGFEIVSMMPNPVESNAILSISSAVKATMEIVLTDLSGKQLSKQRVVLIAGSNQVPLNLNKLAAGTYQVTGITEEGERKSVRFVKQ